MAEARQKAAWNHTAALMAAVYRSQGADVDPRDLHPLEGHRRGTLGVDVAKQYFQQLQRKR